MRMIAIAFSSILLTVPTANAHPKTDCATQTAARSAPDIVDTAAAAGQFATLIAALETAGLDDDLRSDGPFTVFAPLDSAFDGLPDGEVRRLLRPNNRHELIDVLSFHVVSGEVTSDQLAGRILKVDTLEGSEVLIDATDGVRVGNAQVVQADISTSNGVIHIIDRVLIPAG